MYRMYKKRSTENGHKVEKHDFYKRVFNQQFNLKYQKPKKDMWSTYSAYGNKVNKLEEDTEKQRKHLRDKELARGLKADGKERVKEEGTVAATFDME